jgi:hypothetical protein
VTSLAAAQTRAGNDTDGTTKILVTFTLPPGATTVEVYRAGFGHYPEYDDAGGCVPQIPTYPPSAPWTLTGVSDTSQYDEPANRDFWYYVAFSKDGCGNVSPASNMTGGALNYHLGDVSTGYVVCEGDNAVGGVDVSLLGCKYGMLAQPGFECLDVGPTTDFSVLSRPLTDNVIDFEDLMMFAMNFGEVGFQGSRPTLVSLGGAVRNEPPSLSAGPIFTGLRVGQVVDVPMVLSSGEAQIQGIRTVMGYDPAALAYMSTAVSGSIASQPSFFKDLPSTGKVDLSLAMLGEGCGIEGEGVVMTVRFRALSDGTAFVRLGETSLRDTTGRRLEESEARGLSRVNPQ